MSRLSYLSGLEKKYFSHDSNIYKLIVNSTYDNINFINNKSILILPSLNLVENLDTGEVRTGILSESEFETDLFDSPFMEQLYKILSILDEEFSFEFYFYINSKRSNFVFDEIYNFDFFDKNILMIKIIHRKYYLLAMKYFFHRKIYFIVKYYQ